MAELALVCKKLGFAVSGSGQHIADQLLQKLKAGSIHAHQTYQPDHLDNDDIVVISPDIPSTNPEVRAAMQSGLEILAQAQLIQQLTDQQLRVVALGSSFVASLVAAGLSSPDQPTDIISQHQLAVSSLWPEIGAVHFSGQRRVVIDASLNPASAIDSAAEVFYYQPHILVLPDSNYQASQLKQLQHLFQDMAQLNAELTKDLSARLVLPESATKLKQLADKAGLAYVDYSSHPRVLHGATWQAKKTQRHAQGATFELYQGQKQCDVVTTHHSGSMAVDGLLMALATASLFHVSLQQTLFNLETSNGLHGQLEQRSSQPGKPTHFVAQAEVVEASTLAEGMHNLKAKAAANQGKLWLISAANLPDAPADVIIKLSSAKDNSRVDRATTAATPIYHLSGDEVKHFLQQNATASDYIVTVLDQPVGQQPPTWLPAQKLP